MGWFKLLSVVVGLYFVQSYYYVSDAQIEKFLHKHNTNSIENPTLACNDYSDNVVVDVRHRSPKGEINVSGGKKQLCDYIAKGETVLDPTGTGGAEKLENIQVNSSFPWQSATASYDELSAMNVDNLGTIHSQTHQVVEIKRGLLGVKMVAVTSTGGVRF